MEFVFYEATKREEWDQFVLSNPQSALGHLSSDFLCQEEFAHAKNYSIMMYREPGRLVGILPLQEVHSRSLRFIRMRTLVSSTGPLFAVKLGASEQKALLDSLVEHVKQLAKKLDVDRISITYPSIIAEKLAIERFAYLPLRSQGFSEKNTLGTYLDLRRDDKELMASLNSTRRNIVRKIEKSEVQVSTIEKREEWLACEPLNEQTMGSMKHSRRGMEIVWDEYIAKGMAYAMVATHRGTVLSVVVVHVFHECAYYWFAYNARPITVSGANTYLLWRAILQAKQLGASTFLIGSLYFNEEPKTQTISDFKRGFGGIPYYVLGGDLVLKKVKNYCLLLSYEIFTQIKPYITRFTHRERDDLRAN